MSTFNFRPFPSQFRLKNIANVTARGFPLKLNPNGGKVHQRMKHWFMGFNVFDAQKTLAYVDRGRFDVFATLSFPDADIDHLETCLAFYYWAFSIDDLTDEGNLQNKPVQVKERLDLCRQGILYPDNPVPNLSYAHMINDVFRRVRSTATPGTCKRFINAFESFAQSLINQSGRRSSERMLSIPEFIHQRRATIGAELVEVMVEYSLDLKIPDEVFDDPIFREMSKATTDIFTWPNDLCSFNKEQADGDFQNLVCCIMANKMVELQEAVDILMDMLESRVTDYINLKAKLRSYGPEVDLEIAKYHTALEQFTQGTVVWYYLSPRYFSSQDLVKHDSVLIDLKTCPRPYHA